MRCRRGFTLVELLVALLLLDVGLLALVAVAAAITRQANTGRATLIAVSAATARLERLASISCAGIVVGAANPSPSLAEVFSDTPGPNATRRIKDSVAVLTSRGSRVVVLTTQARC